MWTARWLCGDDEESGASCRGGREGGWWCGQGRACPASSSGGGTRQRKQLALAISGAVAYACSVGDPALGHPASRVRQWPPSAPAPVSVTIILDLCLAAFALLVVLAALPRWILVVPLVGWAVAITVYGRRAAKALGIRSRDETPRGWLTALALPGGLVGVLAANSGRSAGFVLMAYVLAAQAGERIVWRRFLSSRPASVQGRRSGLA